MSQLPPYRWYAAVYDQTGQDDFARRAWPYVRGRLDKLGFHGTRALDLACGTGAALEVMRADGLAVCGADASREMLLAARAGRRDSGRLACCDFRALCFAPASFDLVTSFYDSVNYLLTLGDLTVALGEMARVLTPQGLLVFDLNTRHTLASHWTGLCHARVDRDLATVWQGTWDEATSVSSLSATFFLRAADGRWDRFDEVHDERGYSAKELDTAFRGAGLELVLTEDFHTRKRPSGDSRRVFFFLRRK